MSSAYQRWMRHADLDPSLKKELASLSKAEAEDAFYRHLTFGTAGMRGILGPGTNRMNRYTVRRTTEGFARYLARQGRETRQRGVVIAFDSRRMSPEFADEAAGTLARHGIRVHLFPSLRPVPMLSFTVRHLNAVGGIMITASHNPPEYNGYKVYGEDGAQLPPSNVERILKEINAIENELTLPVMSREEGIRKGIIRILGNDIDQAYTRCVLSLSLADEGKSAHGSLKIVFTPLHGTGNLPIRATLRELGFTQVHTVPEQERPDPDFSTVSSPNPEERQAFDLALEQAKKQNADLIIATDPDADRLGLIGKGASGSYIVFNGNQIGALLLHYILERRKEKGILPEDGIVLKSIVTSELGRAIAGQFGIHTEDTLTGFKYIAEKIQAFRTSGLHTFLFGYEESYGYLLGDFVRDKDAVQAAVMCCEMAAHYKQQGLTLDAVLKRIHEAHGTYAENLFSHTFHGKTGQETMTKIMNSLRHTPLIRIAGQPVQEIKDYLQEIDGLPPANVLKFILQDGSWVAVRPSGTEPKIKFYFSAVDPDPARAQNKLKRMMDSARNLLNHIENC